MNFLRFLITSLWVLCGMCVDYAIVYYTHNSDRDSGAHFEENGNGDNLISILLLHAHYIFDPVR